MCDMQTNPWHHDLSQIRSILKISFVQPCISLVFTAVCLQPWITVDMTDHPAGIHLESRRNCLRMKLSSRYRRETVVHTLEYLISDKARPEAFRTVEFEQVRLRLRMPVRKISGPVPSVI